MERLQSGQSGPGFWRLVLAAAAGAGVAAAAAVAVLGRAGRPARRLAGPSPDPSLDLSLRGSSPPEKAGIDLWVRSPTSAATGEEAKDATPKTHYIGD